MNGRSSLPLALLWIGLSLSAVSLADTTEEGVYEYVVDPSRMTFEAAATALEGAIAESSFELVAKLDAESPAECSSRSRVYVLYDPEYAIRLLEIQPKTGPFAVPLRVNLFEDELGVHVSVVNPENVNRTILLDDTAYAGLSRKTLQSLRELIGSAVAGTASLRQYGQSRKKGYIGKTMGVMAGGPFDAKIKSLAQVPGSGLADVIAKLQSGFDGGEGKWGMRLAYSLVFEEQGVAVLGVTGPGVEAKSFSIVKEGRDPSRKKLACAGISHAAAYPIEIVVAQSDQQTDVLIVEAMYRMKMFFEDAGKWAFMKNMGMPGSISDEVEDRVARALE